MMATILPNQIYVFAFDPYGIKFILEKIAFQYPMKCKDINLIWEDGSLHGKGAKIENERRHPQMIEWMWMKSKRLVSHL